MQENNNHPLDEEQIIRGVMYPYIQEAWIKESENASGNEKINLEEVIRQLEAYKHTEDRTKKEPTR